MLRTLSSPAWPLGFRRSPWRLALLGLGLSLGLASCRQVVVSEYEADAVTTYTWKVEYRDRNTDRPRDTRVETFHSAFLINRNGQPLAETAREPDEKGLWWPDLPPQPTVDELEARQQDNERISAPELVKSVDYTLEFPLEGETVTLPTRYSVYRTAVQAHEAGRSLALTLGGNNDFVTKAEMQ